MGKKAGAHHLPEEVDRYMTALDHPFKAEVQAIRKAILAVDPEITEQIKWNAPSFGYRGEYLFTFNLRPKDHLHLVFHNPLVTTISSELLEGDYADGRRMVYLRDREEVEAKLPILLGIVGSLTEAILRNTGRSSV